MELCICEDADARLETLVGSPYLDQSWIARVKAQRLLNRFDIERERAAARIDPEGAGDRQATP